MTCRIDRLVTGEGLVILRISGRITQEDVNMLFIAEETVKVHMKRIMGKLGANHRTQALAIALRRGLLHL
jgi:DNA-binding CsgD family transcriptional regulator